MTPEKTHGEFELAVVDEESGVRIRCAGELDIAAAPLVDEALRAVVERSPKLLTLDWTGLTFMDSTGIRLLLDALALCRSENVDLVWQLSDVARRTLDLVGIHDALLRDYTGAPPDD